MHLRKAIDEGRRMNAIVIVFGKGDVSIVIHLEVQVICSMQQGVAQGKFLSDPSERAKLL